MGLRSGLVKPASEQSPLLAKGCSSQRAPVHVGAAATPPTALPPHTQRVLHVVLAVFYAVSLGACVYVVMGLAGAVPFMTGTPRSRQLLVGIGAAATALAIPLTVYDILCHLLGYVNPLQRYYVRVLWMVIIYACESLTALSMPNDRQYYENMVSCYEAFTVYSFYRLCLDFLGPRLDVERALESGAFRPGSGPKKSKWARVLIDGNCWSKEEEGEEGGGAAEALVPGKPRFAHMLAPCCCLRPWRMGADFLNATSIGVVQYVVVRIACAVATFALQSIDKYGENELTNPAVGYPWIVIVINTSQCWALYCLIMFGYHLWEPLGPLKPMGKFVVIKWIVFLSWWQGVVISAINSGGGIPNGVDGTTDDDLAAYLQDVLICVEMVAAAVAHHAYFSVHDFDRPEVLLQASHLMTTAHAHPASPALASLAHHAGRGKSKGRQPRVPPLGLDASALASALAEGERRLDGRGRTGHDEEEGGEEGGEATHGETPTQAHSSPSATAGGAKRVHGHALSRTLQSPSQMLRQQVRGGGQPRSAARSSRVGSEGGSSSTPPLVGAAGTEEGTRTRSLSLFASSIARALEGEGYSTAGGGGGDAGRARQPSSGHGHDSGGGAGVETQGGAPTPSRVPSRGGLHPSPSTPSLGFLAAMTDMVLPVDVVVDVKQTLQAAGSGIARAMSRKGGGGSPGQREGE